MTAKQALLIASAVCFLLIFLGIALGPLTWWAGGVMFWVLAQAF